jgi:hypothetical protein
MGLFGLIASRAAGDWLRNILKNRQTAIAWLWRAGIKSLR